MTIAEAHEILENRQREYINNRHIVPEELITVNGMAILALGKEIEKEPIEEILPFPVCWIDYKCPVCKDPVHHTFKYCPKCGQKLAWKD